VDGSVNKFDDYEEFDYLEKLFSGEIKEDNKEKLAIALRFDPEKDTAPRIVAAGKGEVAEEIINLAEEKDVPVYQDGNLARDLSHYEVGAVVPGSLYEVIAEMLIFLYQLNESWLNERMEYEETDEL